MSSHATHWPAKSETFVIAVQASMASAATPLDIERQVARFRRKGINFCVYDAERLTEALRAHPAIIDDFFDRAWVEALLGADCAAQLNRLDGVEFSRVRDQLSKFHTAHFHVLDPGDAPQLPKRAGQRAERLSHALLCGLRECRKRQRGAIFSPVRSGG